MWAYRGAWGSERPVFEDGEGFVWVVEDDGAGEGEVGEGVEDGEAFGVGAGVVKGVEGEFEGAVGVRAAEGDGAAADIIVEVG